MLRRLSLAVYNPLNAAADARCLQIAKELKSDIVLLPGTGLRARKNERHFWKNLDDNYWIVHFGWWPGSFTNKAAGCAIILNKRIFNNRDVARVAFPDDCLAGRGGMIRLVSPNFDVTAVVVYSPPRGSTTAQMAVSDKAGIRINQWAQAVSSRAPARTLLCVAGDFNGGFGLDKDGEKWSRGTGDFNLRKATPATATWEHWLLHGDLSVVLTLSNAVKASYYSSAGRGSLPDNILLPRATAKQAIASVNWRVARRLQLIPDRKPRDHVPVRVSLPYAFGSAWKEKEEQWSKDKLAAALQFGMLRWDFLVELEEAFVRKSASLANPEISRSQTCDAHWELWMDTLREVGFKHFGQDRTARHRSPEYVALLELRLRLLEDTAEARHALASVSLSSLAPAIEHLKKVQSKMRSLRRQASAQQRVEVEDRLELALLEGRKAEAQECTRILAGKSLGVQKRKLNSLCAYKPSVQELRESASLPASLGGLSAVEVNWEEEKRKWTTNENFEENGDLLRIRTVDMQIENAVKSDLKSIEWAMRNAAKRKACPSWSVPVELLLMSLFPSYCSVSDRSALGLGSKSLSDAAGSFASCKKELANFLQHLHCCGQVPLIANLSKVFLQPKANDKAGLLGQRQLHLYCHFWRLFYGARLKKEIWKKNCKWDSFAHAYRPGRRREGAMATQNAVQDKLAIAGIPSFAHLRDMTNAFMSTGDPVRVETVEELVEDGAPLYQAGPVGYRYYFLQKLKASGVLLEADDGTIILVCPLEGNIVGSSEGPVLFSWSYNKYLNKWLLKRKQTAPSPSIVLVHPRGSKHTGELVVFADDSLCRRIINPGQTWEQILEGLLNDDCCFDQIMGEEGGWIQNVSKADIVPALLGNSSLPLIAAAQEDEDFSKYASRIVPQARHLGGTVSMNLSTKTEMRKRRTAMQAGWCRLGAFWTSYVRKRLLRSCIFANVVESAMSGLLAVVPTRSQLDELTGVLCGYLRVLEKGKAYRVEGKEHSTSRERPEYVQLRERRGLATEGEVNSKRTMGKIAFVPATSVTWDWVENFENERRIKQLSTDQEPARGTGLASKSRNATEQPLGVETAEPRCLLVASAVVSHASAKTLRAMLMVMMLMSCLSAASTAVKTSLSALVAHSLVVDSEVWPSRSLLTAVALSKLLLTPPVIFFS